ncbi:MAG: GvpL/GvpF family gas vesicle protein [Chloroflexi bacterium]|nr:GvpL/GvpF family gas vesicle protein [Chloroflexota bacterium]
MTQTYLYSIIDGGAQGALGVAGVDGTSPVRTLAHDGLGCVVSDYPGEEFNALSREEVVRHLLAHQRVAEHLMRDHTVLPVRFGTLLNSPQEALALLSQGRPVFAEAMASTRDRVELEVAATWDANRVLRETATDEEVARAREALPREPERQTLEQRVRLGQTVKACMDRRRDTYRDRMVDFLRPLAVDVAANTLVSDEMVMNVALLIERSRQPEFEARVHQLDALFQNEITFRVIGPLPPYSFCTVGVTRLTGEEIEEAWRRLRLTQPVSEAEVRRAYRRLTAQEQLHGGLVSDQLLRLREASELLLRYCRARRVGAHPEDSAPLFDIEVIRRRSNEVRPSQFGAAIARSAVA